jgi:hypothetical protein
VRGQSLSTAHGTRQGTHAYNFKSAAPIVQSATVDERSSCLDRFSYYGPFLVHGHGQSNLTAHAQGRRSPQGQGKSRHFVAWSGALIWLTCAVVKVPCRVHGQSLGIAHPQGRGPGTKSFKTTTP